MGEAELSVERRLELGRLMCMRSRAKAAPRSIPSSDSATTSAAANCVDGENGGKMREAATWNTAGIKNMNRHNHNDNDDDNTACRNTRIACVTSPDTLLRRRYLSRVESMHHKQAARGRGELTQLMMTGISGVRTYLRMARDTHAHARGGGWGVGPCVNEMLRCLAGVARAAG
jgi:hypothetical protein